MVPVATSDWATARPEVMSRSAAVSSAIPIPYTQDNRDRDRSGEKYKQDARWRGEGGENIDYREAFRLAELDKAGAQRMVYVTEGHASLGTRNTRFHSFFLTSQLPFASYPRIANDQRHTGGINALFFDGSARTIQLQQFDIGWPKSFSLRLRYLTTVPENVK